MINNVQGQRFPGYGRCIYCGSTGVLKDEHIIPLSLGGDAIIKNAGCGECEKVTSYLDGYPARSTYNEYRAHVGLKSRRSKQRPTSLPATFVKPDGTQEVRMFAAKDQPYFLMMPIWHLPGIALGKAPPPTFEIIQAHAYEIFCSWIERVTLRAGIFGKHRGFSSQASQSYLAVQSANRRDP